LMDGERILEAEPTITYTALLKFTENWPFYQITPRTDRMNHSSSLAIIWDGDDLRKPHWC
jgi:NADH:ubiquinone oxidoreductase subunit D